MLRNELELHRMSPSKYQNLNGHSVKQFASLNDEVFLFTDFRKYIEHMSNKMTLKGEAIKIQKSQEIEVLRVIKFDGSNNKELVKKTNYNIEEKNFDKIIQIKNNDHEQKENLNMHSFIDQPKAVSAIKDKQKLQLDFNITYDKNDTKRQIQIQSNLQREPIPHTIIDRSYENKILQSSIKRQTQRILDGSFEKKKLQFHDDILQSDHIKLMTDQDLMEAEQQEQRFFQQLDSISLEQFSQNNKIIIGQKHLQNPSQYSPKKSPKKQVMFIYVKNNYYSDQNCCNFDCQ